MTRKHYQMIADALRSTRPYKEDHYEDWLRVVQSIARALAYDNPKFNKNKFETACGVEE